MRHAHRLVSGSAPAIANISIALVIAVASVVGIAIVGIAADATAARAHTPDGQPAAPASASASPSPSPSPSTSGRERASRADAAPSAGGVRVTSPDGRVIFTLRTDAGGALTWLASFRGAPAIEASRLKVLVDRQDLGARVTIGRVTRDRRDETYAINGGHAQARDRSNGARVALTAADGRAFSVEIRAADDGVAFRTLVPGEGARTPDEETVFTLPAGSRVWSHDLYWHYEGQHVEQEIAAIPAGNWAAPPITIALPPRADGGRGYAVITESALMRFSGMALQANGRRGFVTRLGHAQPVSYPFAWDYSFADAARLAVPAVIDGPITTPWRVVLLAPDLDGLVNSDLITNLAPPPDKTLFPDGARTDWIKPGRSTWLWLDGGARTVEGVKEFSDLAGQLGFEYNVVDAFWSRWTDAQIRDLVDYSRARGVGIWLWKHGRDIQDRAARRAFFKRCQDLGVVGVKLDAFSHEAKAFIDLYQDALRDAAEFKLLVNIHGSNKPAGEARTWPNELAREGIRGLEYRSSQAGWARHNVTLPFTRLVAGHGDYTPLLFGDGRLDTTATHQIASAIILGAPVLMYGAHPKSLLESPAVEVIKSIPPVWDETRVLSPSAIGELAAFARRRGDVWFLAVMNGTEPRTFQAPLAFLGSGFYQADVIFDRPRDAGTARRQKTYARAADTLPVQLGAGGGYVVRFTPMAAPATPPPDRDSTPKR